MGYSYYDADEKRLQRKLIPLNIFVAILCLVAAVSLMVTPFIQVDLGKIASIASEMTQGDSPAAPDEGSSESSGSNDAANGIVGSLEGKIGFSPLDIAKLTFSKEENKASTFVKSILFKDDLFGKMMTTALNTVVLNEAVEITEDMNIDYKTLEDALKKVDGAKNKEEFQSVVSNYIAVIEQQTGETLDADAKANISDFCGDMYDDTVAATEDGKFSIEAMVCVFATDESETKATTYEELFDGILDGTIKMPGAEGDTGLADSMKQLNETLDDAMQYFSYVFYAFCAFAGVWLILFLFALLHTFAKNKRFTMWYVKIFGGIPCLIFGVALKVLGMPAVANALFAGETTVTAMLGAISTMTWISGGCYLLLWLVSIFWAFPIKRKIRKLRK